VGGPIREKKKKTQTSLVHTQSGGAGKKKEGKQVELNKPRENKCNPEKRSKTKEKVKGNKRGGGNITLGRKGASENRLFGIRGGRKRPAREVGGGEGRGGQET